MSKLQHSLWFAYQQTHFKWHQLKLSASNFVIVTAYNSKGIVQSRYANHVAHRELLRYLRIHRKVFSCLSGMSVDGAHVELSVAVACSVKEGKAIALKFKQNAMYWVNDDQLYLQSVLMDRGQIHLGAFSLRCLTS
ncbi:DUF3293 domain-containing protein [Motilimonas cestriensis]|uniref:DUF3293 domain-containing protein n=1 Tax=Motilimonas cestriensis TaxID=2742685 RepID=A0ABS8W631_9GAMM|nr:DUF3293 domain-containing protein [Motilimonas cestriensis]MCE2594444.1 DUF3293 domain-containing protein [Motilimonas cestriensis]